MMLNALDWTANPEGVRAAPDLRACRTLVLAHWATQGWAWVLRPLPDPYTFAPAFTLVTAILLTVCLAASFTRYARRACAVAAPFTWAAVYWTLPSTPNHTLLVCLLLLLFVAFDPEDPEDDALLIQGVRWIVVLIFFYAGLQKALHGMYFRGEFLTWMISHGVERWADLFGWMIPAEEIERVKSYPRYLVGGGPYRIDSVVFWTLSNSVWVGEIALAFGLLFQRTRLLSVLLALFLVLVIQLPPREFMFAILYSQLIVLFVPGEWQRKLMPVFLMAYLWLILVLLGGPGRFLLKPGGDI